MARARFRCDSVEIFGGTGSSPGPRVVRRDGRELVDGLLWPRTYRFVAVVDPTQPPAERLTVGDPSAVVTVHVDNEAITFVAGEDYYLDFTLIEVPL